MDKPALKTANSLDIEVSDPITTEKSPSERLPILFTHDSERIDQGTDGLEVYKLPLIEVARSDSGNVFKYCVGDPRHLRPDRDEKVMVIVGATGTGKSTLINAMANYILGVQWEDNFRFKLIHDETGLSQVHCQTERVTSYSFPLFEESPLPYQLTVVDTPGFGDTRGLKRDELITKSIKEFFSMTSAAGIDHIDGIGFVVKSPDGRLTYTQKYIFDSILAIFGRDIAENIFMMTTFCDGAPPPVMDAVRAHIGEADIPLVATTLNSFKFNNSALYSKASATESSGFDEMYWKVGYTGLQKFFDHLRVAMSQSLTQTREVLHQRERLQLLIQGVQQDIRQGMSDINEMQQEKRVLEEYEARIRANKDFTYTVEEVHTKKVCLDAGTHVMNCLMCNRTCHRNCSISNDDEKSGCWAITDGYCRICPGKCHWQMHVNNDFQFEDVLVKVTKRFADLEMKYREGQAGKATAEAMIAKIRDQVEGTFKKVCEGIHKVQECLQLLEQIALHPNHLTEVHKIDLLIECEKSESRAGWQNRVKCYEKAREMAVIIADARKGELAQHMNLGALMDDLLKDVPSVRKLRSNN